MALGVADDASLRTIWVLTMVVSTGRQETLGDDGGDLVVGQFARALPGTFDEGAKRVVRQIAQRRVDLRKAGPGRQQGGQYLTDGLSAVRAPTDQDLPGDRPDSYGALCGDPPWWSTLADPTDTVACAILR